VLFWRGILFSQHRGPRLITNTRDGWSVMFLATTGGESVSTLAGLSGGSKVPCSALIQATTVALDISSDLGEEQHNGK